MNDERIERIERNIAKCLNNDEVFYGFQATTNAREIEYNGKITKISRLHMLHMEKFCLLHRRPKVNDLF